MNSILRQEYSNYHIIFIDDGSDDGTGQLIQKFAADNHIS
jgi:glycosyltransferase involved in cell wall biosynthesis